MSDTQGELSQQPIAGNTPEEWLGSPDAIQSFRATLDRALERLAIEVAAVRAERDGLRLELEGVRSELELARADLAQRERFDSAVRELKAIVSQLNVPVEPLVQPFAPPPTASEPPATAAVPVEQPESLAPRRKRARRGWLRKALARVGVVLAVCMVLVVLLISVGPKVAPYETFFVRSGSMEPTFDTGDLIVLGKIDASDIRKGDIITFERPDKPGTLVTHRVVAVETTNGGKQFETKGDANNAPDLWRVPASGTHWKYKFRIPKVGYVFGYLSTPLARLALLAIPAVLLGLLSLIDIWKPRPKSAPETGQ